MQIVLVGSTAVMGSAVPAQLGKRHDVVAVGRTSGSFHVDIAEPDTFHRLFVKVGAFDALVGAAGAMHYAPWTNSRMNGLQLDYAES